MSKTHEFIATLIKDGRVIAINLDTVVDEVLDGKRKSWRGVIWLHDGIPYIDIGEYVLVSDEGFKGRIRIDDRDRDDAIVFLGDGQFVFAQQLGASQ